mgnify:CR=1 FL=1
MMDHAVETERIKRIAALEAENERLRAGQARLKMFLTEIRASFVGEEHRAARLATEALRDDD